MGKLIGRVNQVRPESDTREFPTGQRQYETYEWKRDWVEIIILGSIWAALTFLIIFK